MARYDRHRRRGLAIEASVLLIVVGVHAAALRLMMASAAQTRMIDPPSSPAISTWNILESNEAPPARIAPVPKASVVQVNLEAPNILVEEPAPIAAGLGATMPVDPYAGASPVKLQAPTLVSTAAAPREPELIEATRTAPPSPRNAEPVASPARASAAAPKPVRCEVLAQPGGGFTSARIAQSSGDVALDRHALVAVMRHQELVAAGMVDQPRWLLLTDDELARSLNETR